MKTFFFLLLLAPVAFAQDLCSRDVRLFLDAPETRIAFANDGGLANGGVCWWHSRLQRASAYLVRFEPETKAPTAKEVERILLRLRTMKEVVTIPGFPNFESFTRAHQKAVQSVLDGWQRIDGFLNQQWIRSISGRSKLPAEQMQARMKEIFKTYKASPVPVWVMAQVKGITSHAFLLLEMQEEGRGFHLKAIDSNKPGVTRDIVYNEGDEAIRFTGADYSFVPYVGFQGDFVKMASALKKHCPQLRTDMLNAPRGDIEVP